MSQLSTHCFSAPDSPFSSCSAQIHRPRRAFLIHGARDISLVSRGHCRRKEGSLPGSGFRLLLFSFLLHRLLGGRVCRDSLRCPPPAAHRQSLKACGRAQASDPFPWPSGWGCQATQVSAHGGVANSLCAPAQLTCTLDSFSFFLF